MYLYTTTKVLECLTGNILQSTVGVHVSQETYCISVILYLYKPFVQSYFWDWFWGVSLFLKHVSLEGG